jgi:DNA-binding FadR family transcriptional regulator
MRTAPANSVESRDADVEFHVALLYATENRFYIRMRDFIRTALNVSIGFTSPDASLYDNTVQTHARILRAIEDGDVERARQSTRELIDGALFYIEHGIDGKS